MGKSFCISCRHLRYIQTEITDINADPDFFRLSTFPVRYGFRLNTFSAMFYVIMSAT